MRTEPPCPALSRRGPSFAVVAIASCICFAGLALVACSSSDGAAQDGGAGGDGATSADGGAGKDGAGGADGAVGKDGAGGDATIVAGTTSYVQMTALPALAGAHIDWLTGEPMIARDVQGAHDLVGIVVGSGGASAYVSKDDGASWGWVSGGAGAKLSVTPGVLVQDDAGKLHALALSVASGDVRYSRVALARDGQGHVTGFSTEVSELALSLPVNSNLDVHMQLAVGKDQSGAPTLLWAVYDDPQTSVRGRVRAGKVASAAGLAPASAADFVALDESPGATAVWSSPTSDSMFTSHVNAVHIAQLPASGDVWLTWGPADTLDTGTGNTSPLERVRATPSGPHAWSVGAPTQVDVLAAPGVTPQPVSIVSTPNHVWFLRFASSGGLHVDRADASGQVTTDAIPSPLTTAGTLGSFALAVDPTNETQAWIAGWLSTDSSTGAGFRAAHWDGAKWTPFTDAFPANYAYSAADNYGVGRSIGWNNGLSIVFFDPPTHAVFTGTIRTQ